VIDMEAWGSVLGLLWLMRQLEKREVEAKRRWNEQEASFTWMSERIRRVLKVFDQWSHKKKPHGTGSRYRTP